METPRSFISIVIVVCFNFYLIDSSICKPYSVFKIDCNSCQCSSNGETYTCSTNSCPQREYKDEYDITEIKGGYKLLVPKSNNKFKLEDDDFTLKGARKVRLANGYPYINDEMYVPLHNGIKKSIGARYEETNNRFNEANLDPVESMNEEDKDGKYNEETNDVSDKRWDRFLARDFPE